MTDTPDSRAQRLRSALRKLWTTTVMITGLAVGLVILRLVFWPPQPSSGTPMEPSGFMALLGIAMLVYLASCIWHYTISPVLVLVRDVPLSSERYAAMTALLHNAVHCGLVFGIPVAIAMAYDLPGILSGLQLLLLWGVYTYLKRYRGPAITAALSRIEIPRTA